MKEIKIFIASAGDLEDERNKVKQFINDKSSRFFEKIDNNPIRLIPVMWEGEPLYIKSTRQQDKLNEKLEQCEIVIFLFFTKLGKFTQEEWETTLSNIKKGSRQKVYLCFKTSKIKDTEFDEVINFAEQLKELKNFKDQIKSKEGQYCFDFKDFNELKIFLTEEIEKILPELLSKKTEKPIKEIETKPAIKPILLDIPQKPPQEEIPKTAQMEKPEIYKQDKPKSSDLKIVISIILFVLLGIIIFIYNQPTPEPTPETKPFEPNEIKSVKQEVVKPEKKIIDGGFQDNEDGTITDLKTKLMWKKCSEGLSGENCDIGEAKLFTWEESLKAKDEANKRKDCGYSDWRVPTIDELKTLVDKKYKPTIDPKYFPNTEYYYWSSSSGSYGSSYAWALGFYGGYAYSPDKTSSDYVRVVRAGQ